ncbi:MAG: class IV adenylate cyclase [Gemmatimonadales bacterium]
MARNVEIKARLRDLQATRRLVEGIADGPGQLVEQTDTFFRVKGARLKLRERSGADAELIYYRRPDSPGPKESDYETVAVRDAAALRELLAAALGVAGRVLKRRLVYRLGRTRIHLDDVRDLGPFLELEVELASGEPADVGVREAKRLMGALEIGEEALIAGAYVDLLDRRST